MGVLSDNAIIGASNAAGYDIDYSCRIGATHKLQKTISGDGNKTTWTMSIWTKNAFDWNITADNSLFSAQHTSGGGSGRFNAYFRGQLPNTYFECSEYTSSGYTTQLHTQAVYRDPAAWLHVVVVWDTSNSTETDRLRFYFNGERITAFGTGGTSPNYPSLNESSSINAAACAQTIGALDGDTATSITSYLAEVNFIDGQALGPENFGELDEDTNEWKAIEYAGTYGTKGYYLDFSNSAALGTDSSGNGNDYTPTGLTASDQMIDTPQNSTGGNFCTMNPLAKSQTAMTFSEGNLEVIGNSDWQMTVGTMPMSSGKWYCELLCGGTNTKFGIAIDSVNVNTKQELSILYYPGSKIIDSVWTSYGATFGTGDIIGYAIDMDGSTITFYKNGASQGAIAFSGSVATAQSVIFGGALHTNKANFNFGQDSSFGGAKTAQNNKDGNDNGDFYYTPPSGYLALCSNNLADPSIALPTENFETIGWAGSSSNPGAARTIGGLSFQPDFFFQGASGALGSTSGGGAHLTYDVIRGFGNDKEITTDSTKAMGAENADEYGFVSAVTSTGVTYSPGSRSYGDNVVYYDTNGAGYVRWNWLAGGTGVANTDGNMDSTVSANTAAGFSICKYEGQSNGSTTGNFGHGLSAAPEMVIIKNLTQYNWIVYATVVGNGALVLNDTHAFAANNDFGGQAPSASVVYLGNSGSGNQDNVDHIAYCFHSVEGYSKVGKYVSNNVDDGPFIYLGFTPAFIMLKCTNATDNWNIYDNKRKGYNGATYQIRADTTAAGFTSAATMVDLVSNGMKIRTNDPGTNGSSRDYVYLAFAENPFKTSRAR